MPKSFRHVIFSCLLLCALLAPVISFLLKGAEPPYGQRPATQLPSFAKFWKQDGARKQFSSAIVEALPLRKTAIRARNSMLYPLHMIDNARMASGRDGWLFHKHQFRIYECGKEALLREKIDRFVMMAAVAHRSDLDLTITSSPNKATVVPENLSGRARLYARCYETNRRVFSKRLFDEALPNVVDHAASLLKYTGDKNDLYFATDTHWTNFGGAFAVRDLAHRVRVQSSNASIFTLTPEVPPDQLISPDMRHGMLLINQPENQIEASNFKQLLQRHGGVAGRTVIIQDSFYQKVGPRLKQLYKDVTFLHVTRDRKRVEKELNSAKRIIVNGVERSLINRFYNGPHNWSSPLGRHILQANQRRAKTCRYGANLVEQSGGLSKLAPSRNMTPLQDKEFAATTTDPNIMAPIATDARTRSTCVRVEISVQQATTLAIYPERTTVKPSEAGFGHGWSVHIPLSVGNNSLYVAVPRIATAQRIRIDPVSTKIPFKLQTLQIGVERL